MYMQDVINYFTQLYFVSTALLCITAVPDYLQWPSEVIMAIFSKANNTYIHVYAFNLL